MSKEFFCQEKRVDRAWKWTGSFEDAPEWVNSAIRDGDMDFDEKDGKLYVHDTGDKWFLSEKGDYLVRKDFGDGHVTFWSLSPVYFFEEYNVCEKESGYPVDEVEFLRRVVAELFRNMEKIREIADSCCLEIDEESLCDSSTK